MSVPFRRVRFSHVWLSALEYERRAGAGGEGADLRRPALRFGWEFTNAREYGYSISREQGLTALVTAEHVRRSLGAPGRADAFTAEVGGYLPAGTPHAVLALRAGAGTSSGDEQVRRVFELGGAAADRALFDFGAGPLRLLRGFRSGEFIGRHVALVNLDYRLPLARFERGYGTLPVFLRTAHASLFLDAGHAWDRRFAAADVKTSAGSSCPAI